MRNFGIEQVRYVRITVHRQPARRAFPVDSRSMERERRHIHDIALAGNDVARIFNRVTDLPLHHEPEFRALGMKMAPVLRIEGR